MDPLSAVDEVRRRMGYQPITNSMFIDGPQTPDPLPLGEDEEQEVVRRLRADQAADQGGPAAEESSPAEAHGQPGRSPLIPLKAPTVPAEPSGATMTLPISELMVAGSEAIYRGQPVVLDEVDQKAIATVILRAAQRKVEAQLEQLAASPSLPSPATTLAVVPTIVSPKKPLGRPRLTDEEKAARKAAREAAKAAEEVPT